MLFKTEYLCVLLTPWWLTHCARQCCVTATTVLRGGKDHGDGADVPHEWMQYLQFF